MLSGLSELIPTANGWPSFGRNKSEQFEARVCTVEIKKSPSIFLQGMEGSRIPCIVSHGEGKVSESGKGQCCIAYVQNDGIEAGKECYPSNPNGSAKGETGFTTEDGRVLILMPHPERTSRRVTSTWMRQEVGVDDEGPWMKLFHNARKWVDVKGWHK